MIDTTTCSECLGEIQYQDTVIIHNNWVYCDSECLNDRILLDLSYAWIAFKNLIDEYDNEPFDPNTWGVHTLQGSLC